MTLKPFQVVGGGNSMTPPTIGEQRRKDRRMEERCKQRRIEKAHKRLLEEVFAEEIADKQRRRRNGGV